MVEPTAELIVVTPICSHAHNTSSVVLSAGDTIEVEICEGRYGRQEQVSLCFDGAEQTTLVTGEKVCIRKAEQTARLIQAQPRELHDNDAQKNERKLEKDESQPTCKNH